MLQTKKQETEYYKLYRTNLQTIFLLLVWT